MARRALGQVAGTDEALDALDRRLTDLLAAVTDVGAELADYESQLDADPAGWPACTSGGRRCPD